MSAVFGEIDVQKIAAGKVRLEVSLPNGDVGRFYSSSEAFLLNTPSIVHGVLPENFYVADIDYFSGDANKPEKIKSIELLSTFIKLLSEFAEDSSELQGGGINRLLFVLPPDGRKPQKTVVVPIILEATALDNTLIHLRILEELVDPSNEKKLHIEERRLVMRTAIGDVLSNAENGANLLTYLAKNWREVLHKYRHNFQAYINNFAFDEVRKKIADAEIEYASKLSGVLGDIAGKLLALPVSLVALIALEEAKQGTAFWIGCIGLIIVTIIYVLVLHNQALQVKRLKDSFDLAFSPFFGKMATYPAALKSVLEERKTGINKQIRTLRITFCIFYVLAFVPTLGVFYQVSVRYHGQVTEILARLFPAVT
ncbi:hypothetical protein AYR66_01185 [Noviherbaspirillum denitrificans]|uniref:Uncharacterized protein n=2 Tax=Noviherbaspirillum denitrificans TaxID=1968433 RepID=A0A254T6S5_9BURK|nr:hypothetical protein AYR66_01185 [Noviherbaspirillum denitrificans]